MNLISGLYHLSLLYINVAVEKWRMMEKPEMSCPVHQRFDWIRKNKIRFQT